MARWIYRLNKQRTTAENSRWEQSARLLSGKVPFSTSRKSIIIAWRQALIAGVVPIRKVVKRDFPIFPRRMSRLFTIDWVYNQMKVITILSRFHSGAY